MARERRQATDVIDQSARLEIREGINLERYSTKIKNIRGTTIKLLSPMIGDSPREVEPGTPLTITMDTEGIGHHSFTAVAGTEQNHSGLSKLSVDTDKKPAKTRGLLSNLKRLFSSRPDSQQKSDQSTQRHQYFDERLGEWILIVQQPDDLPIKYRELVRAKVFFPVILKLTDSDREYGEESNTRAVDLSGLGMRLSIDIDEISEIPKNTKVILDFQLPNTDYELPLIKGTVVRTYRIDEYSKGHAVGIKFDPFEPVDPLVRRDNRRRAQDEEDQQVISSYVVKREIENRTLELLKEVEGNV